MNFVRFLWLFSLIFFYKVFYAQNQHGVYDSIRVGTIMFDNERLPHYWIGEVYITEKASSALVKKRKADQKNREAFNRLRYNVYKVYPYAVAASFVMHDVDSVLQKLYSKDAKKLYKERKEQELNKQFKGELENLTIAQGQILVKLIARETGKPCYQIIKDLKGGFNARIWQTVALLFDNNLKNNYDPNGEDAAIEVVVQEIIQQGRFERKM